MALKMKVGRARAATKRHQNMQICNFPCILVQFTCCFEMPENDPQLMISLIFFANVSNIIEGVRLIRYCSGGGYALLRGVRLIRYRQVRLIRGGTFIRYFRVD